MDIRHNRSDFLEHQMSSMPEINPSKRFATLLGPVPVRFNAGFLANAGRSHHRYEDDFFRAKSVFAFSTGIFMQIHAGKIFSLQPEVIYDYNGSKSASGVFPCKTCFDGS